MTQAALMVSMPLMEPANYVCGPVLHVITLTHVTNAIHHTYHLRLLQLRLTPI